MTTPPPPPPLYPTQKIKGKNVTYRLLEYCPATSGLLAHDANDDSSRQLILLQYDFLLAQLSSCLVELRFVLSDYMWLTIYISVIVLTYTNFEMSLT